MKFTVVAVLFCSFLVSGCSHHIGNFTALSTGTFRGENIDSQHLLKTNASASNSTVYLLGLIPLGSPATVDQAVSEALGEQGGDIMTNVRLYHTWSYLILFGSSGYRIEGDIYRTSR
jgi:hypothetical protein